MILQSNADLRPLTGLLPVSSVCIFVLSYQFVILHFINTCLYTFPPSVFSIVLIVDLPEVIVKYLI